MNRLPGNRLLAKQPSVTRTKRPRMAAFGEWNTTNLGDQAIFEGVQAYFEKIGWDVDAYGLGTLTPVLQHNSSDQWSNETRITSTNQFMPNAVFYKNDCLTNELLQPLKQIARGIRQQYRINMLLPQLSKANAILVGGGLLLSDHNLHFPQSLVVIARAAKKLRIPLFCLGCGAVDDWSPKGKAMITEFVEACTHIAVRERETSRKLSDILAVPIPVFGDFALSLPIHAKKQSSIQPTLAVNVMQLVAQSTAEQERYESVLVDVVNHWVQQFDKPQNIYIKVFTTGTREDSQPAKRVASQLMAPHVKLYIPENTDQLNQLLQNCTAVLASRLHAAILAISQGMPVIGLGAGHVSQKLYNFFQSIGIDDYSLSVLDDDATSKILKQLNCRNLQQQSLSIDLLETTAVRAKVSEILCQYTALKAYSGDHS